MSDLIQERMDGEGAEAELCPMPDYLIDAYNGGVVVKEADLQHNVAAHLRHEVPNYAERWQAAGVVVRAFLEDQSTPEV